MLNIDKPLLSFVISVKDRSHFLREALVSLQCQTLEYWECIVVDDYSNEDIKGVVVSLNDDRFKYFRNPGSPGISSARNFGNGLAQADWIAVADSDDINLPRRAEVTLDTILANKECDVLYSPLYLMKYGTYDIEYKDWWGAFNRDELYVRNLLPHVSAAYRKDLALSYRYDESLVSAVDYDLWLSFADNHHNFVFVEEPVVIYRMHGDQISTDPERVARQTENAERVRLAHLAKK